MELLSIYDAQTEILRWLASLGHEVIYMGEARCPGCKLIVRECHCFEDWSNELERRKTELEREIIEIQEQRRQRAEHGRADAGPVNK